MSTAEPTDPRKLRVILHCLFLGHRYDKTIMQMRPIPMIHCDRCGRSF